MGDFLEEVIGVERWKGMGVLRTGISTQGAVSARPEGGTGLPCLTWGECRVRDLEEAGNSARLAPQRATALC